MQRACASAATGAIVYTGTLNALCVSRKFGIHSCASTGIVFYNAHPSLLFVRMVWVCLWPGKWPTLKHASLIHLGMCRKFVPSISIIRFAGYQAHSRLRLIPTESNVGVRQQRGIARWLLVEPVLLHISQMCKQALLSSCLFSWHCHQWATWGRERWRLSWVVA